MDSTTVYYNHYSVDAVITAAYMKKKNKNYVYKTFTNYSPSSEKSIFVGCYPIVNKNNKNIEIIHLDQTNTSDPDIEGINYKSLLINFFRYENKINEAGEKTNISNVYRLMLALSEYNKYSANMSINTNKDYNSGLENLAFIWTNWKKANKSLLSREEFEIVPADVEGFKEMIQIVKSRLNSDIKVVPIVIKRSKQLKRGNIEEIIRVPFINTNVSDAPWYGRFLSHTYDYGILYEVVGNQIIVVPWSKDNGSLPDLTSTIKHHIAGKDYTVVFANS
jgi:hypothetical protein